MDTHWDAIYSSNNTENLGWYEPVPTPSLQMIAGCQLTPRDAILDIGAGSSTLFDNLLKIGYQNLIAADLSKEALNRLEMRIADNHKKYLQLIVDDITHPAELTRLENIKLWHDRALLHFLHDQRNKQAYLDTLRKVIAPNGFIVIAAFSRRGAEKCSGLPVHRYSAEMLAEFLGPDFNLLEQVEHTYHQPSGSPRPFIYTRFQHSTH